MHVMWRGIDMFTLLEVAAAVPVEGLLHLFIDTGYHR